MTKVVLLSLIPLWCAAQSAPLLPPPVLPPEAAPAPPPNPMAVPDPPAASSGGKPPVSAEVDPKEAQRQAEKLIAAVKIGREWQNRARDGKLSEGMALWGHYAFSEMPPAAMQDLMENQLTLLGALRGSYLMEDRSLVDMAWTPPGEKPGTPPGVHITLVFLNDFEKGLRRETVVLFEPQGGPMKITGVRREELPGGRTGAAEMAVDLGQVALLKLREAPRERWEPWLKEAQAHAARLNLKLPEIPDSATGNDPAAGEKIANLIIGVAPGLYDQLGEPRGMHEGKVILNAFAMLLLYQPGDETCTRLAVLAGAEAEKAKLPPSMWKPLIKAVSEKKPQPVIHELVLRLSTELPAFLGQQEMAARVNAAPRRVLDQALLNMEQMPSYKVRGELVAGDGRRSVLEAALGPGAMYLQLEGFDGRKQTRLATQQGCHISRDGEKSWEEDKDLEGAMGLCRTVQAPLDRASRFTEKHTYSVSTVERLEGEDLFVFRSEDPAAPVYWILMSKAGPVIRRAGMKMKFGDLETDALMIYTRIGKEPEIPEIVGKEETPKGKAP